MIKGPQRTLAVRAKAVSAAATTGIGLLPKLTARVWFLSPPSVMRAEHGASECDIVSRRWARRPYAQGKHRYLHWWFGRRAG
ncbi:hypothetical protein GCM10010177_69720 [Actinomadura citrea]|nr:hypothetical protein GCM10010177_69720 [Actinomadura citrea]